MKINIHYCIQPYTRQALTNLLSGSGDGTEAPNLLVEFVKNTILRYLTTFIVWEQLEVVIRECATLRNVKRQTTQGVVGHEELMRLIVSFICTNFERHVEESLSKDWPIQGQERGKAESFLVVVKNSARRHYKAPRHGAKCKCQRC